MTVFFALGGHSLLAVRMIERLRRMGLGISVQTLFQYPTLSVLAQSLVQHREILVPDNGITPDTAALIPAMLPLIDLSQPEIDFIVGQVPGGIANIQDIYALSPLQDGILFHHLLANEGDPYLLVSQMAFADRSLLDRYLMAIQWVVDRHDILRTAFIWQGLSVPAQVVWRQAPLSVTELTLDPADGLVSDQLSQRFDPLRYRLDLNQAPLLRFVVAQEGDGRWIVLQLMHHLIGDHTTLDVMNGEVRAYLAGQADNLPDPIPFRNLVAQARLGVNQAEHARFFTDMLAGVDEPTLSFGLTEVHHDGSQVMEYHRMLTPALNERLRGQARRLGVSLAALCHLAWAQVLSRTSGQEKVVFGTVLFGRMQAGDGADSGMGLFINTLPLRLDMDDTPVQASVMAAHRRLAGLLVHEHASLALAQRCSGVASGTPLFNVLLNYRHNALPVTSDDILNGIEFLDGQERTNYPFALSVEDFGDALGLTAQVVQPFDPARICGYMQQALESLAAALEQAPETPVRTLEILSETERTLLLKTWNATETAYSDQWCIHQLFEQQVEKTPDATALMYEGQTLSYTELNIRANRLAHQLIALGVAPDQPVAICVSRSLAMVVGLLAVLKAGGAYVPLDPAYPGERLAHILRDAVPAILLADNTGCNALGEKALAGLTVLDPNLLPDQSDRNPQIPALTSRHLAYVIYTSGSTGTPKGVMVEHRSLLNLHGTLTARAFASSPAPYRVSLNASISFDAALQNILGLLNGYTLVIVPQDVRADSVALLQFLVRTNLDVLDCTPMQLDMLLAAGLHQHQKALTLLIGGEPISVQTWQAVADIPQLTSYNVYGPTECTVDATLACIEPVNPYPTIGRPLANTRLYLLDKFGCPVPLGVVGELYIGGAGVARGYLNRSELTAERFLIDPFSEIPGARLYRTGDVARYLPDGNLEFLGRNDQQVKIRGFRIEPGEIEARLTEYPAVSEAVVLVLGEGQDKRLVAYVVAEPDDRLVTNLRAYLSTILPDYMVPAAFVRLATLPLTPNGKLDRQALPVPDEEAFARQVYEAPQGEMEQTLAAIWCELLGIEQIGRHDNFFALGGHSLLAVRMMNRIAALGVELPLSTLFKSPSLAAFVQEMRTRLDESRLGEQGNGLPAILPISREGALPLSFAQQRLWFLTQFEGVSETYHISMALRLCGQLNIDVLQQALDALFIRHEALRSVFVSVDGQPQVELLPTELGLPMRKYDLRKMPDADEQFECLCVQEAKTSFDLAGGPLIRAGLIQRADDDYVFLLTQHHIVSDGWSVGVLMRELSALYTAFSAGLPDPLPLLAIQYPDYAAWQRQWLLAERVQIQSDYWKMALADAPILLDLPTDRPRPPEQSFAGHVVSINLDAELTISLKHLSEQQGTTLFMTLLSAWAAVLSRLSGQDDVVIGTPSAGRNCQEVESLIGFFVNTLALRIDLSGAPNVAELLARVRQTALIAQEHQDLPFEQVVEIVQPPRRLAHTPLFQVMFAWQNNEHTDWTLPGLTMTPVDQVLDTVRFDLELNLFEEDDRIVGTLSYATALFDQATIERHVGYLRTVLQMMVADPQQPVGKIDILAPAERRLLLETWNAAETAFPAQLCVHQLFEQQVEQTPDAIALVYEERTLSYVQLNAHANRLAHQLIALGITPDQRVAICMARSPAMVVGLLAVLKAGGAYVPLDPAYPSERLVHILNDAAPVILLADNTGRAALGETGLTVLDPNILPDQPDRNPQISALTSRHLAYVIYTSGSTGRPKGVMVEHRGVVNLALAQITRFGVDKTSRILQFASSGFDASVSEIMTALSGGACLIIPTDIIRQEPRRLWSYLEERAVTHAFLPPALFREECDLPAITIKPTIIFAGEAPGSALFQMLCGWVNLFNDYGPTEITVCATSWPCPSNYTDASVPIGRPTVNTRVYLLDAYGQPVPLGAVGELYIGGVGVARGYLHRLELTAERFLADPFSHVPDARMYRTGDLARYLPDGNLIFVGRNDQQIKIRGFRIEPGEIEARLMEHPAVQETLVLGLGDGQDKRLVAYVVAVANEELVNNLRAYLSAILPDYMVPAAFVRLETFPLTPNGKLDRRALPAPDEAAFARQVYAAPQGEMEIALVSVWRELLGVEQISRHDNFFALGGHSLLAVRMIERLRRMGLGMSVQALFQHQTLNVLAQSLSQHLEIRVPDNGITPDTSVLTPEMLPLIDLTQPDIDAIVEQIPGGIANIQDIYALSPLQDGILFHHLLAKEGDPYLLVSQMAFADRLRLDRYLEAVQRVVDRHDILRTAFVWQGLSVPAQVVCRQAQLLVTDLTLDPADGPVNEQLAQRFDPLRHGIDLCQAPLLRFVAAQETDGRWMVLQLLHHLIGDHTTLEVMDREVQAYLAGQESSLPAPVPFRNLVAQVRLGVSQEEHTRFFTEMLAEVDEPTLPFGLTEVHCDGSQVTESHRMLPAELNDRLRSQARRLNVSLAALCHLAWAQVLSRTSGQEHVVFGTVLFGRMAAGEGADNGMGLFINTLPLRLDMDNTPVQDSVQAAHRRLAGLLTHEHASLVLAQRCSQVQGGRPLFSALLNYRHNVMPLAENSHESGIEYLSSQERTNYPLMLSVEDFGDALGLTAQIVQPFDPERVCGYIQQALESLVTALEQAPETPVRALEILPETERTLLLKTWNATEIAYPDRLCIHQLFEQQVEKKSDAPALVYEGQTLSYAELNTHANRLAHQLMALGVTPDQRVAICVARSPAMVVGMLAVLKAGGAYVPLDPDYPGERLLHILHDAAPVVLLADNTGRVALGEQVLSGLIVLDPNILPDQPDSNPQVPALTPRHLAYVIYTSGSTGMPKGVMIEHWNTVNFLCWAQQVFAAEEVRETLFSTSMNFDLSVFECFMPLSRGAAIHLVDDVLSLMQHTLPVTLINSVPSAMKPLLQDQALTDSIHTVNLAGEPLKGALIKQVFDETPVQRLCNLYGPSETTTYSTWLSLSRGETVVESIGRPIANTSVYLLDAAGQPVPLGVVGEIYIGGAGVVRGYLNRPELTAEHFLTDPFSDKADARMYRTGDLARYLPDGKLEFLGRNDQQVKIRGFRIEPGEIEARLTEYPAIQEAVVLALGDGQDKRLVAYVVVETDNRLAASLHTYLSALLPDYMVPAAFVCLEAFPLTPNGKLDRRALPVPDEAAFAHRIYAVPQGDTEIALAAIWRELLGVEQVSRHDSFFALGGHSLLAVRMVERLRHLGLMWSVRDLFQFPVLSELAQVRQPHQTVVVPVNIITPETTALTPAMLPLIDLTQTDIDGIVAQVPGGIANIQDIYALSPLQDGILFHHLLENEGDPYLLVGQMAFADRKLLDRYLAAVQQVIDRHDILRTAFIWQGLSVPAQVVCRQARLSITELTLDPADGPVNEQLALRFDPRRHRIDLCQAPLLRFVAAQETDGRWIVLQLLHHLIGDHSTLEMMVSEVRAYLAGQGDSLPVPIPFRNLVTQARLGVSQEAHTRFFTDMLAEVDEPTLMFGLTAVHHDGSQVTESHRMLTAELNDRLRSQARRLNVSLAALCHLAWAQVLSCTSGQEQAVFGTVLFGRMQAGEGADSGMGLFINTLPLRLDMDDTPVRDGVRAAHTRLTGLLEHEHASLALAQRCSGVASGTPLFNALLNYRHNTQSAATDDIISGVEFLGAQERTNYPFVLSVEDSGADLGLTAQVVQPFDPARICGYMQQALESLAATLEQVPETPVRALNILPETERRLLLKTWNATETAYPEQLSIHQLFEQQVEKNPDATALIYEEQTLSYAELNARANRLAHQLIVLGVAPDQPVAICVASSPARVMGLLAVLKAGGAYVPLDPAYPGERLLHILTDAAPTILLADNAGYTALGEERLSGLTVLDPNSLFDQLDSNPQISALTSCHLAYVIYTSGSTGTPKGVMVEHRGLINLIRDKIVQFDIHSGSRMLQFASLGFDACVWEIMMALGSGASLVIAADFVRQDPFRLWHYLEQQAVTHACLTPALLRDGADLPALTITPTVILGGEAPSAVLLQALCNRVTLFNAYGPTEITVCATAWRCPPDYTDTLVPIGHPTANTQVYLLDACGQPVPLGAVGELYIGGAGVARGYLNRPELTTERFLADPFSERPDARMYRTGDLARYLPDGNLVFIGRNDQQIKIRGFRIEPGEIEVRLIEHPAVREAAVLALGEGQDPRLVAWVVAEASDELANSLRTHLSTILPDYMVPAAFVRLDALPLTPNGKLDRRALPALGEEAFARQIYAAPQGEMETALAAIWRELLGIEQISRYDNFFALGGHSLLAVRMVERLRNLGLTLAVRELFQSPMLCELARTLGTYRAVVVPANVITPATTALTPAMLPLVNLTQTEIDLIVRQVPDGIANIQDIYALSPLQDGILFHHLLTDEGDPYLLVSQVRFADRLLLDRYLAAVQWVVDRHDILRTAFLWQGLSVPVQVVWRQAPLSVTEVTFDPADGSICDQLAQRFDPRRYRLELNQAPLLCFVVTQEEDGSWGVLELLHHLIGDHTTLEVMNREVQAYLTGQESNLPTPVPFRHLIAQARLGMSPEEHSRFFTDMLAEVEEPTLPFGLAGVHHDGAQVTQSHRMLTTALNDALRRQADVWVSVWRRYVMSLGHRCCRVPVVSRKWYSAQSYLDGCRQVKVRIAGWGCLLIPCRCGWIWTIRQCVRVSGRRIIYWRDCWNMSTPHWRWPSVAVGLPVGHRFSMRC